MKKLIPMKTIPQFREVVKNIKHLVTYDGKDEDGNSIYTPRELPTITIKGTEKLHGTNMGISFNNIDGFWVQSKENIITPEKDNAACAFNAYQNQEVWENIILQLTYANNINLNKNTITIFAEWCGGNIQKTSAVTGLDKRAVIFKNFKVTPFDVSDDIPAYWLATDAILP